ncbi:hypothetical protein EVAR_16287_1 [Eumeta japonica]|uniref:BESS domain-containing protein n=1 Tax=Eumeta variegata TaxID=151549 RepID=A0A4C2A3M1_EUMVA|nr:hypothetical protein EVAR_16287_1 [Eumeta japonica]
MSFVASFLSQKTLDSVELSSDDEESQEDATEVQNPNSGKEINSTDAVDGAASHGTEIRSEDDSIIRNISSKPQHSEVKKAKAIKTKVQPKQSASAVSMSRLLDEQINVSRHCDHDELDRFFLSISETVKKVSPYLQAIAKNKTFSLVSEMELQQLASPRFITTTPQYTDTPSPASTSSSKQAFKQVLHPYLHLLGIRLPTIGIISLKICLNSTPQTSRHYQYTCENETAFYQFYIIQTGGQHTGCIWTPYRHHTGIKRSRFVSVGKASRIVLPSVLDTFIARLWYDTV